MKKLFWLLPLLFALPLLAVIPHFWEIRSYEDFRQGELSGLSITSDGELVLAPRFDLLFDTDEPLIFSAVADSNGNVLLGTGHNGKVYRIDADGNGALLADFEELDVLALALNAQDELYAATSPDGKVYRIDASGNKQEFFDPEDKYIWSMLFNREGNLMVATGDQGVIYEVGFDGSSKVFYDSDETHIITMAIDSDGNLIAGGNPKGYVYRISDDGQPFVLYDSGMQEVHALALSDDGVIYAAVINSDGASLAPEVPLSTSPSETPTVTVTVGSSGAALRPQERRIQQSSQAVRDRTSRGNGSEGTVQSAILEVGPDGVVTSIWQSSFEMIFALLPQDEGLLFSTGTKGRIYNLESPHSATLVVESPEEQTTQLVAHGNRLFAASSNAAKLFELNSEVSTTGFYESNVRNTEATSSWGKVTWKGGPGEVELLTRTGNTGSPNATWSGWTSVGGDGTVFSPKARFIQWKAVLRAGIHGKPLLSSVRIPYLQQNFRPDVTSVSMLPFGIALQKIQTANNAAPPARNAQNIPPRRFFRKGSISLQWVATDRNGDELTYALEYKAENEISWRTLEDDLKNPFYTMSSDTLPDGNYVFRVVASDEKDNPSDLALIGERETRPFAIDNSSPIVTMVEEGFEDGRTQIRIEATDHTSTLKQAEISVDAGKWRPVFPVDGIIDSLSEKFAFPLLELAPGEHVIAFRIYDQNQNVGLGKTIVTIP